MENETRPMTCGDGSGALPECAPLAVPYIPVQPTGSKKFGPNAALDHGTLFPGLDLPFRSTAAPANAVQNALNELQALEFVLVELGLYLDTHQEDSEAFALFQEYTALEKQGRERYEAMYGPITQAATAQCQSYNGWLRDPWPWNLMEGGEG